MGRIRIGLTISGAVSLGSFEGGALAALLTGVQALQSAKPGVEPDLRVDAMGAASAGAITAVATARVLTAGVDPVWVMQQAWVKADSLEALLKNAGVDAPLSMKGLAQLANGILSPDPAHIDPRKVQMTDVLIDLALTNLRGLDYQIGRIQESSMGRGPLEASTYLDWGRFTFKPNADVSSFTSPSEKCAVDTGLASGANEFGFPPKRLARAASDYRDLELINFPAGADPGFFWYTDGGTINNEPLGRTLSVTNEIDLANPPETGDHRVHVLIHPFPTAPPPATDRAWANGANQPTWLRTLLRAMTIIRAQSLFDDMRQAEKTNSRLIWKNRLIAALGDLIDNDLSAEQKRLWGEKLKAVVDGIEDDLKALPRHKRDLTTDLDKTAPEESVADYLEAAIDRVSDLAGRNAVGIEVVSPYLAQGTQGLSLDQILAGEFLEAFGGFFHEGLRRSDFALGFVCMLNWMENALPAYGLASAQYEIVLDAALRAFYALDKWTENGQTKSFTGYGLTETLLKRAAALGLDGGASWSITYFGEMTLGRLPFRERLMFAQVAGRI